MKQRIYVYSRLSDKFGSDMMHPFGVFSSKEYAVNEIKNGKGKAMLEYYMNEYKCYEHNNPNYISFCQNDKTCNPIKLCFLMTYKKFSQEELVTKRLFGHIGWSEN